ncbi:GNAT family N-acetyltransferase [bacterium]|nr:GNAT family N-acetyltransferase [bacterium]MBU1072920.1 GNAT family N-acetyltransferase [bacterium]MBU1674792.1 GNAT family N-acetyltransferase [bacterium]
MGFTVAPVSGKKDLDAFLHLPYRIYADDPHYVYPLLAQLKEFFDRRKNPFFKHAETGLWLARRDGEVIGRIGACVDRYHNEYWREQIGFYGFYECIDDAVVSHALLDTARDWLRERGMTVMRGPLNFTTNHDNPGLLIDGEPSPPVTGMSYNPTYYQDQFESYAGLAKCKDLWAWRVDAEDIKLSKRVADGVRQVLAGKTDLTVRPIDKKDFRNEVELIRSLYNDCWNENWGFIPMDPEEFYFSAKEMKTMVNENLLLIAEWRGEPIGFSMTIPDFNLALKRVRGKLFPFGILKFLLDRKKITYARTLLLGVLPEHRRKGVDVMMVLRSYKAAVKGGITAGECSWILEDNTPMNNILEKLGARVYKTYRIYDLPLS